MKVLAAVVLLSIALNVSDHVEKFFGPKLSQCPK